MLRLTKVVGNEIVLVNADQIVFVEVGGGGVSNVYMAKGEMVKVQETIEQIDGMIRGGYVPVRPPEGADPAQQPGPKEFKADEPAVDSPAPAEEADDSFSIPASAFDEADEPASGKSKRTNK